MSTLKRKSEESAKGVDPTVYWVGRGQNGATDATASVGKRKIESAFAYNTVMVANSFARNRRLPAELPFRAAKVKCILTN